VPVGPHPLPWPDDPRLDPALLASGDARNVVDRYRYWRLPAIVSDLRARRTGLHVAVENLEHDLNIGSIVRTANAFNVGGVHIVGRRRWNRRGAMVTDAYLDIHHHPDVAALAAWAEPAGVPILAVDVVPGAVPIEGFVMPDRCALLFGQEGPGLSSEAMEVAVAVLSITQHGSTRSINVAAAAAIAMHTWMRQHGGAQPPDAGDPPG
jgi:tRNA G18 (ribose-2'-O)-methylase SpoU